MNGNVYLKKCHFLYTQCLCLCLGQGDSVVEKINLTFIMVILPNHKCVESQKELERVAVGLCSCGAIAVPSPENSQP